MTTGVRDEGLPLLTGGGRYLDDIAPPGCLHVAFLRSPWPSAAIAHVDAGAAASAPGVVRVFAGADLAGRVLPIEARMDEADWYRYQRTSWPVVAVDEVRFVGEIVAAVVAADAYAAEDACARIEVGYEPIAPVAHVDAALADGARRVHAALADNLLFRSAFVTDAAADPFPTAPVAVRGTFRHPRVAPSPLECCGCVALHDRRNDVVEVWSPTQAPHMLRDGLARFLQLPESRIRVAAPDIGGAFGVKMPLYPEEAFVAFAARRLGRPVKWTQDRREHLQASYHARDARIEAALAADGEGRILGLRAAVWCDAGAYSCYPLGSSLEPHTALVGLPGPYVVPWLDYASFAVATNKCPTGPYRGVGFALAPLVTETLIDKLARRIGIDRTALRRRNMAPPDAFPFRSASGAVFDSGDYPALLSKALARADYDRLRAAKRAAAGAGRRLGVGLSCFVEPTAMGCNVFRSRGMRDVPAYDSALLRVSRAGSVEAYVTTPALGQQPFVAMRRIVARMLHRAEADVSVRCADTGAMPHGSGAFASRGLVAGGGALQRAARKLVERMTLLAAIRLDAAAADVVFEDGRFGDGRNANRFATFEEIADFAHSPASGLPDGLEHGLQATASFDNPGSAVSAAAHVALVEVDMPTGAVRVLEYVVAEDCGPIANPDSVDGQIRGAVLQGVGAALLEEIRYDDAAQLQTGSFADYMIPTAFEAPDIGVVHLETPSPFTEGGYKGMGESGTIGAPAAIAGAVIDALDVDWTAIRLPLTPERVLALAGRSPA